MRIRMILYGAVVLVVSCANPEIPENSRIGQRESAGNADLRLPSHWGSNPSNKAKWWQGPETRYPNSGYYSSENR